MKIRQKLVLGFLGIALLPGIVGVISILQNETSRIFDEEVIIIISVITVLLATGLGLSIAHSIYVPLTKLKDAVVEIGKDKFGVNTEIDLNDEIGQVADAFNKMSEDLSVSINKIKQENFRCKQAENRLISVNYELDQTVKKLSQSNKELQDFVYVASHDLREPLRTISSFGQLLQESLKEQLDADDRENLQFMIDGANRMTQMIEAMLIYSRVGTKGVQFCNVDLNEEVEELKDLELAALLKETDGTIFVPDLLPLVNGDSVQIRELLQNLIGNALKYHKPQIPSEVWIRGDRVLNNMVRIEIEDNGIGIKEEYYKDVFTMFRRLHSGDSYKGTGIGLSVCKKIIERHGGEIGVCSDLGKGARFWFTLPAANVAEVGSNEQEYEEATKTG